jgi:riboflavin synthase
MFTGLIETTGIIDRLTPRGPGVELVVRCSKELVAELSLGESVAVDGACLTVTHYSGERFTVDASAETMQQTTLGERYIGQYVHLERALKLGDRLGGHWVTGHVDGIGRLRSKTPLGEAVQVWFDAPIQIAKYLVTKGSIAIDGASLTVNELDEKGFSIVIIPHTLSILRLNQKPVGSTVNLESDILGKYVEKLLSARLAPDSQPNPYDSHQSSSLNISTLVKAGFLK